MVEEARLFSQESFSLQAAASVLPKKVLEVGNELSATTAEGYPRSRFHAGSTIVDNIEEHAVAAGEAAFGASYVNVQPLSGSSANLAAITSFLSPGDPILSLGLEDGGHLSHGSAANITGKLFDIVPYAVRNEWLDYEQIERLAIAHQPKLIICGGSSYPRTFDFRRFREIADKVGAILLADISHIAGLVAAKIVESPINHAHVTTTSTYKQLFGPRGGLILSGSDADSRVPGTNRRLRDHLQSAVFPGFQGTPDFAQIAQKAVALEAASSQGFQNLMNSVQLLARDLADTLQANGLHVQTGGTDTHMVLINLSKEPTTGLELEKALEEVGIIANRNLVPNDTRPPSITSGLRLGTNVAAFRGIGRKEIVSIGNLIAGIVRSLSGGIPVDMGQIKDEVRKLCRCFPLADRSVSAYAKNPRD